MIAKLNGFTDEQITEIKKGTPLLKSKLNAIAQLVRSIVVNRGKPHEMLLDDFFSVGYTTAHLVELLVAIGDNTISNLICRTMNVPTDEL